MRSIFYIPGTKTHLVFPRAKYLPVGNGCVARPQTSPRRPFAPGLPNFYRFLFNGFKSFNSFSKVLFIFPSRYLFAIGFPFIFSLGRSLSPYLSFNPKKLDSVTPSVESSLTPNTGISPSLLLRSMRLMRSGLIRMDVYRLQFAVRRTEILMLGYYLFSRPY